MMGLEADESLLTGESEPVSKHKGDRLLSGSFVVAGAGSYQAVEVGAGAYAPGCITCAGCAYGCGAACGWPCWPFAGGAHAPARCP